MWGGLMEFYLSSTHRTTQGEMHAPNNIIPLSVRLWHTPNTSHISQCALCADKVSIKLLVVRQKWLDLLQAQWSYPEEWSYPSYMIRPSVLLSLEASRSNQGKPWWQLSWYTCCCNLLSVFASRPHSDAHFWPRSNNLTQVIPGVLIEKSNSVLNTPY